jgi:flagellar basal body P-ring formation protein FlgA
MAKVAVKQVLLQPDKTYLMKYKLIPCFSFFLLAGFFMPLFAAVQQPAEFQQIPIVLKAVEDYVYEQTKGLPGQVIVSPGKIDNRITLPNCPELVPFIPTGGRLWGNSSVGVRCNSQTSWTIYVQVDVQVMANVIHVARPLTQGRPLTVDDITLINVNLTQMPEGIFTDPSQVIGKIPISSLATGQPIRQHSLRLPHIILRGQKVKLNVQGRGFSVSSEGHALADAAEGQVVQVRNQSGRIISGIALPDATVDVHP